MTEIRIRLKDDSKLKLLLAFLRRLGPSEEVNVAVEQNGRSVAVDLSSADDARFEAMINQVIEDALAGRLEPRTAEEKEAEWSGLAAYGERKAAELGITSDEDVDRLVKEYRTERKTRNAA